MSHSRRYPRSLFFVDQDTELKFDALVYFLVKLKVPLPNDDNDVQSSFAFYDGMQKYIKLMTEAHKMGIKNAAENIENIKKEYNL